MITHFVRTATAALGAATVVLSVVAVLSRTVDLSGSGDVRYSGDPLLNQSVSGSGSVSRG